ncbi:type IV secretory system conjugative DNA transfer family protein [Ellagibacter isourolithinifaciens]|uniref:type IV secretory system conjugative DNA transfer family protein n=1 Tax=Ellagibacter isourolithinifaciens TaxID=2137581 RepID=UPI003A9212E0
MGRYRGTAILAAAFAAVIDIVCYPIVAPATSCMVAGAAFDWMGWLDAMGFDLWAAFWTSGEWFSHVPFMLAGFALTFLVLFGYSVAKEGERTREVDRGIYGDARVIRGAAELNRRNDFWDGTGMPERAGLVLGADVRGYWFDSSVPHALTCGKTGSGKTQLQVLETMHLAMAAGWNVVSTGKPEVLELTADKARGLGYETVVLDLTGYPGASRYNPIGLVADAVEAGDTDAAVRTARQVAVDLIPLGGEKNTYFPKAARNMLAACILVVCTADIPRNQKNLASVAALVDRGTAGEDPKDPSAPLKDYIRGLGPTHPAFSPASDLLGDGGATTAGKNVVSTLKETLGIFSDGALRAVTSESAVSIRDLIDKKTVLYIEMLDEGDPYGVVYTCFLNQWWQVAQQVCKENGGRMPHETALVLDEIGNLNVKVACLPAIATLGRSMKIHEYLFVQNLKQLNAYNEPGDGGAGRDKLIGSIGTKVALSLSEPEDFKFFTALAGKRTVRSMGTSSQQGSGRSSSGTSYSETAVPLINEWEWQQRIPIRDGLIAIKGGENSKPGREGVFEFPLDYANRTPAGPFFGLGDEEAERQKRSAYYARAKAAAGADAYEVPEPWCPDFDAEDEAAGDDDETAPDDVFKADEENATFEDEWAAWDE